MNEHTMGDPLCQPSSRNPGADDQWCGLLTRSSVLQAGQVVAQRLTGYIGNEVLDSAIAQSTHSESDTLTNDCVAHPRIEIRYFPYFN
jgi:hypothetical protein